MLQQLLYTLVTLISPWA